MKKDARNYAQRIVDAQTEVNRLVFEVNRPPSQQRVEYLVDHITRALAHLSDALEETVKKDFYRRIGAIQ